MQRLTLWRLLTILLLAAVPLAAPATTAIADEGEDDRNDQAEEQKENDDEQSDDDRGNEQSDDDRDDEDGQDDTEASGQQGEVVGVEGYTVDVDCQHDADANRTTCTVTAVAPEGGKDVSFVQLPEEYLCAEVLDTEAEYVDPDPNTHVTGYKSRGSEGRFTLDLEGEVAAAATATYWIKTGDGTFPASGPTIGCGDLAADTEGGQTAKMTPSSTEVGEASGTVAVATFTCTDVPADTTGYDWFGQRQPGETTHTVSLSLEGTETAAETDATGEATVEGLEPGEWALDLVDASWCHAKSDSVNAESEVVVESGKTATVWLFLCEGKGGV